MTFNMLSRCPICHVLMSSTALDFHRTHHSSFGQPFKCLRGCVRRYFETYDERELHDEYFHDDCHSSVRESQTVAEISSIEIVQPTLTKLTEIDFRESTNASCSTSTKISDQHDRPPSIDSTAICNQNINLTKLDRSFKSDSQSSCSSKEFNPIQNLQERQQLPKPLRRRDDTLVSCMICGRRMMLRNVKRHMKTHKNYGSIRNFTTTTTSVQCSSPTTADSRLLNQTTARGSTRLDGNKARTAQRSIRDTPTVQMQFKMEPVSPPLLAKQARRDSEQESGPHNPLVYDELNQQKENTALSKPPSLTVLPVLTNRRRLVIVFAFDKQEQQWVIRRRESTTEAPWDFKSY